MKEFDELLEVAAILNGSNGCSWDKKQTFFSLQPYVIEEAHEVIEAVDMQDDQKIIEELGDLLYTIVFYAKIAQKENRFSIKDIVDTVKEKLIRRHPHVFGELKIAEEEDIIKNWEKIKKEEKKGESSKSLLDGIAPSMPLIPKAQKILKKILQSDSPFFQKTNEASSILSEEEIGKQFVKLIVIAEQSNMDAESALRRELQRLETVFRDWENNSNG